MNRWKINWQWVRPYLGRESYRIKYKVRISLKILFNIYSNPLKIQIPNTLTAIKFWMDCVVLAIYIYVGVQQKNCFVNFLNLIHGVFFFFYHTLFLDLFEFKWLYEYKIRWNIIVSVVTVSVSVKNFSEFFSLLVIPYLFDS